MLDGWEVCLYVMISSRNLNKWISYSNMYQKDVKIIMSFLYHIFAHFGIWEPTWTTKDFEILSPLKGGLSCFHEYVINSVEKIAYWLGGWLWVQHRTINNMIKSNVGFKTSYEVNLEHYPQKILFQKGPSIGVEGVGGMMWQPQCGL